MSPEPGRADVLIYVQHLLGIGHLQRAAGLARACAGRGLETTLVSGGLPVDGLELGEARLVQLPPLRAGDATFSFLADAAGRRLEVAGEGARREALLAAFHASRPRALLIEMFPFGRRALRFELLPLLEAAGAAAPPPLIACSLRDVVNHPVLEAKSAWICATLEARFDLLLVHGDPDLIALAESFPAAAGLGLPVIHTGYVAPEPPEPPGGAGSGEVIVAAGGGAVGGPLLDCALAARDLSSLAGRPWRLIAGPNADGLAALARRAPAGVIVDGARPDYRQLLAGATLSISQAGYNSMVEILQARVPAVVVPYAAGQETEQSLRARAWARRGLVQLLPASELSPAAMAAAVDRAADGPAPDHFPDLGGAARTAEILAERLAGGAP